MERRERGEACLLLWEGGELFITGTYPTGEGGRGRALVLRGERTAKALDRTGARRPCWGGLSGGYEVYLTGTRPAQLSRGYLVPIDGHIHGVLTLGLLGGRSGGDIWSRGSPTPFQGGSVVIRAFAAMGGRGRATGRACLIVSAPGARGIPTSVRCASMMKQTNKESGVRGGTLLSSVSVSPAALTLGGVAGREVKFDVVFLREDDDA